ncbi:MAG TPA: hypothetical protein PKB15_06875 [Acidimicrobiia bacterium]|nr:hypothetical protein [Acidimicrobiia bacterium]
MFSSHSDHGMTTISYVLATSLSLIVITWCAMFIVMSYARASIRGASDRASRAGVVTYTMTRDVTAARNACRNTFAMDISEALPTHVQTGITSDCQVNATSVNVHTRGTLRSVSSVFPAFSINETTKRSMESLP